MNYSIEPRDQIFAKDYEYWQKVKKKLGDKY